VKRRKSYEIPIEERLAKLPPAAKVALQVESLVNDGAADFVGAAMRPHDRFRTQHGELITYSDGIYLRYHINGKGLDKHGRVKRVKTSEFLCPLGTPQKDAEKLQAKRMKVVNLQQRSEFVAPTADSITVAQFFDALYFPSVVENKKPKTAAAYKNCWDLYLKEHFERVSLERYSTVMATEFLESLGRRKCVRGKKENRGKTLSRATVGLCRSLCYAVFKRAKAKGLIEQNPFEDADPDVKLRKSAKVITYTLREVEDVILAIPRADAKLLFAFCGLCAMRPSEAAGVRWEDIDTERAEIRLVRNVPSGIEQDEMKTENSAGIAWLIPPVAFLLKQYRAELLAKGKKLEGYLFKRRNSNVVIDVDDWSAYNIGRFGKQAIGERWAGLYPGRRCVGTALYNLTGDARSTFQALRNEDGYKYIQPSTEQGRAGMQLLAAELKRLPQ
jgi:integrase